MTCDGKATTVSAKKVSPKELQLIQRGVDSFQAPRNLDILVSEARGQIPDGYHTKGVNRNELWFGESVAALNILERDQDILRFQRLGSLILSNAINMWEYPRPSLEIRARQPIGRSKYHAYEIEEHKKRRDGALFDWHAPIRLLRVAISGASNIARYSSLCNAILATYVQRSIGNDPPSLTPAEVANLPKPVGYCRPSCQECRALNEFLTDDNQAEKTFRIATPQRRHMENMLMNAMTAGGTPAWEFSTIKSGSPYGLLVRKYQGISLQKFGDWNSRCTIARSDISQIAPEHVLRSIIGDAQYIAIMQRLTPIHPQQFQQYYQRPSGLQERNMSAMNYGAPPPQEGPVAKRRRVETIDLT